LEMLWLSSCCYICRHWKRIKSLAYNHHFLLHLHHPRLASLHFLQVFGVCVWYLNFSTSTGLRTYPTYSSPPKNPSPPQFNMHPCSPI
jgi:hypothetical protein